MTRARPGAADAVVTLLLFGSELVFVATRYGPPTQDLGFAPTAAQLVLFVVLYAPLLLHSRAPVSLLLVTLAIRTVGLLAFGVPASMLAPLAALYAVAAARAVPLSSALWAGTAAVEYLIFELTAAEGPRVLPRLRFGLLALSVSAVPWLLGAWSRWRRLRREAAERERERRRQERVQRVVADERAGMARELHDILAHSISVMVLQAAGGREVLRADPERAARALAQIEATGRQSMGEVRRLLGLLTERADGSGLLEPTLDRLADLADRVRGLGIDVRVRVEGARSVPAGVDLAAYRIVQEALTNVVKHAPAASATVTLRYGADGLEVEVSDDGPGVAADAPTPGRGLVGMRERARLVGGELAIGPGAGGGFRVAARLPLPQAVRA